MSNLLPYFERTYPLCTELHSYLARINSKYPDFIVLDLQTDAYWDEFNFVYRRITLTVLYAAGRITETSTFYYPQVYYLHDNADRPLPCKGCTFYHGKQGVVCAVHPEGVATQTCKDWDTMH